MRCRHEGQFAHHPRPGLERAPGVCPARRERTGPHAGEPLRDEKGHPRNPGDGGKGEVSPPRRGTGGIPMKLSELRPAKGSKRGSKRVGRGQGSGSGRTAGGGGRGERGWGGGGGGAPEWRRG